MCSLLSVVRDYGIPLASGSIMVSITTISVVTARCIAVKSSNAARGNRSPGSSRWMLSTRAIFVKRDSLSVGRMPLRSGMSNMGVHRGGDEKTPGWGPGLYRNGAVVSCHICNAAMVPVVDFGPMPLANGWHDPDRREPLALVYCQTCHLYQISHILPPDVLFADYSYRAGTAGMQRAMFAEPASVIQGRLNLGGGGRGIGIRGERG